MCGLIIIGLASLLFSPIGGTLLLIAAVFVSPLFVSAWPQSAKKYAKSPAIVIDDQGVTFNEEGGPRRHPWLDFGEAFVFEHESPPILLHLPIACMHLEGRDRHDAYHSHLIDFVDSKPEMILECIRSHPSCPSSPQNREVKANV